jgi:hypothetical protein
MIFTQPLPFISDFVEELDRGIRECAPHRKLSTAQRYWLRFCLMGILLANQVCWAAFARGGLRRLLPSGLIVDVPAWQIALGRCCSKSASG